MQSLYSYPVHDPVRSPSCNLSVHVRATEDDETVQSSGSKSWRETLMRQQTSSLRSVWKGVADESASCRPEERVAEQPPSVTLRDVWRGMTGETSEKEEVEEQSPVMKQFQKFQYTPSDVNSLVDDDQAFRTLQRALRKQNCTTNLYLTQNLHVFMHHVKGVRQQKEREAAKSKKKKSNRASMASKDSKESRGSRSSRRAQKKIAGSTAA